jgi:predicted ATP-grasp superfamily ATP-dependent carboligase
MIRNADELKFVEGMIIQDWMAGTPASVSVIGNGHESRAVAENEQLIGASWSGADEFRYSGNITPLYPPNSEIAEMAEEIVSELGLVGSNGIDFILTKRGPIVVEVNPRFQGSLDTVELSTGINVFQAHLKSFEGILPERQRSQRMAGRAIIYAEKNLTILEDLSRERITNRNCIGNGNWITDIPNPGSKIRKGDPITSVLVTGKSREEVKNLLIHRAAALRITVKSWDQMAI